MLKLTADNYYSPEADREYMSCSSYDGYLSCEAKQTAKIQGRFIEEKTEAFLVGQYFHTALEGKVAHAEFLNENFEDIYTFKKATKKDISGLGAPVHIVSGEEKVMTGKKKAYETADIMLDVARKDPVIGKLIDKPGKPEVIMTGEIHGIPWKVRFDKYVTAPGREIIDWKTSANLWETKWDDGLQAKVSFIRLFDYITRAAVYIEIEKQNTDADSNALFTLACLSKQDPPDKDVFYMNHPQEIPFAFEQMKKNLPRIQQIREGLILPKRCGVCDYCRSTKKIGEPKYFTALDPGNRPPREDEYPENLYIAKTKKDATA